MTPTPKKMAAVVALALCLAALLAGCSSDRVAGSNLLTNGTFEANDGSVPTGWSSDCWDREEGFSLFSVDPTGGTDGGAAAVVENAELNDARFQQMVKVERGKLYRLSGDIRVQGADGGWGANLSFKDTYTYTKPLLDTSGGWQHMELYARAAGDQKETTVYVRLGGYGSTTRGKAWFDNISLEQVDSLPSCVTEGTMATSTPSRDNGGGKGGTKSLTEIVVIAMLFGAAMLWAFKRIGAQGRSAGLNAGLYAAGMLVTGNLLAVLQFMQHKDYNWAAHVFCGVFLGLVPGFALLFFKRRLGAKDRRWIDVAYAGYVAVAVRIFFAISIKGYPNDIDCWVGWASQASQNLFGMYKGPGFLDYPPGYMYALFFLGKVMPPSQELQWLVVKLPSIAADIGTAYFIYRIALTRLGERQAAILGLLYVFNPLVIVDSAAWGQIDSILTLIIVACFWNAYRNRMWQAALIYGIGLLVKPQVLLFGPAMLAALLVACMNARSFGRGAALFLKTVGAGLAGFVLPALPFWITQISTAAAIPGPERIQALHDAYLWLPNIYVKAAGTYPNATINACNLLALLGGNWAPDTQTVFGLPYAVWGYAGMILVCLFTLGFVILREKSNRTVFLWAAVLISGLFVLGLRMHERYMFPVLALLLMHYALERDRRALYLFGLFSTTQFLNVAMVLANEHMPKDVLRVGDFALANPDSATTYWAFVISLAAVGAFAYMAYAAVKSGKPLLKIGGTAESGIETGPGPAIATEDGAEAEAAEGTAEPGQTFAAEEEEGEPPMEERAEAKERKRTAL